MIKLSGSSTFQWPAATISVTKTTSGGSITQDAKISAEVIYPDKGVNGEPLYAKLIYFGSFANAAAEMTAPHQISSLNISKVYDQKFLINVGGAITEGNYDSGVPKAACFIFPTYVRIDIGQNRSTWSAIVQLVYAK